MNALLWSRFSYNNSNTHRQNKDSQLCCGEMAWHASRLPRAEVSLERDGRRAAVSNHHQPTSTCLKSTFSYSVSLLVSSPGCLNITCYSLDTLNHSLLSILCILALFQSRPCPSNPTKRDSGPTRKTPNPLLTTCIRQTRPRYSLIVPRNSRPTTLPPNH